MLYVSLAGFLWVRYVSTVFTNYFPKYFYVTTPYYGGHAVA
jgi:hypothetical protein